MTDNPDVDLLSELFHSEEWKALKQEILVCLRNAERDLKRPGLAFREFRAGECTAYETILGLEEKYKNVQKRVSNGTEN